MSEGNSKSGLFDDLFDDIDNNKTTNSKENVKEVARGRSKSIIEKEIAALKTLGDIDLLHEDSYSQKDVKTRRSDQKRFLRVSGRNESSSLSRNTAADETVVAESANTMCHDTDMTIPVFPSVRMCPGSPTSVSSNVAETTEPEEDDCTNSVAPLLASLPKHFPVVKVGNGKYRLLRLLGEGGFGEVYSGIALQNKKPVAIKLEFAKKVKNPHLQHEAVLYNYFNKGVTSVGIPHVYYYGKEDDYNIMVMDLLGPSVEDLFQFCKRRFSMRTVYMLLFQMIDRLEFMHGMCYIHRDIKPENFVMGLGRRAHHVYIVDMGLAKKYYDMKTEKHIPFITGKDLTGTARFCSLFTHLGYEQSRRDDIEAVAYCGIYLCKGALPWQGFKCNKQDKYDLIKKAKQKTPYNELCAGLPQCFVDYMKYARELRFSETPNYEYCRGLFEKPLKELGGCTFKYSWLKR